MRSGEANDGPKVPNRSRASKVQQNVLTIIGGTDRTNVATELEALGDKTAATLATSFERLLRSVCSRILTQPQAGSAETWIFHMLVGDGIPTNEAAAKLLLACIAQKALAPGTRYLLMVVKCATHQAALSAKSAVEGRAAKVAGGELWKSISGVSVRLYKYVINDYFEEFVAAVRTWLLEKLVMQKHDEMDEAGIAEARAVQNLYTQHVIPDSMLRLWNNGFRAGPRHRVRPGEDPNEERPRVLHEFIQWIVTHHLRVDSSPTLTRFFTFRECVDNMFGMQLIGLPDHFQLKAIKPRKENQKRLKFIKDFFKNKESTQIVRRCCLAFQLTGGMEATVSEIHRPDKIPPMVKLVKGEVAEEVQDRLRRLLEIMAECDPELDLAPATSTLLAVAIDLERRLSAYVAYPYAMCGMCRKYFKQTYQKNAENFVTADPKDLDVGVGLQLFQMAWKNAQIPLDAVHWLLTKAWQFH